MPQCNGVSLGKSWGVLAYILCSATQLPFFDFLRRNRKKKSLKTKVQ